MISKVEQHTLPAEFYRLSLCVGAFHFNEETSTVDNVSFEILFSTCKMKLIEWSTRVAYKVFIKNVDVYDWYDGGSYFGKSKHMKLEYECERHNQTNESRRTKNLSFNNIRVKRALM